MKKMILAIAALAAASTAGIERASAQELKGVTIGSGSVGADFFVLGTTLQQVLSKAHPGAKIENTATTGSVENARLLRKKEIDVGVITADAPPIVQAWKAEGQFKDEKPYTELRNLAGFFHFTYNIIVRKDSPIKTYADLKGKRIGIGPDPVLNDGLYSPFIEANGLNYKNDLNRVYASYADIFRMLKEGRVDGSVGFTSGFNIPASIQELNSATPIRWLTMDEAKLKAAKVPPVTFPKGALGDEPVVSARYGHVCIMATDQMKDDVAYAIVKSIHKNFAQLSELQPAVRQAQTDPGTFTAKDGPMPYHPGAIKYWKEAGLWKD